MCSRQQADGLISGAAWGRLELPAGLEVEHPALKGSTFRCCPACVQRHPSWEDELLTSLGVSRNGVSPHPGAAPSTGDVHRPPEGA